MDYFSTSCTSTQAFCKECQKNWPKPLGTGVNLLKKTVRI